MRNHCPTNWFVQARIVRWLGASFMVAWVVSCQSVAEASIVCPDLPEFTFEEGQVGAGPADKSAPAEPTERPTDRYHNQFLIQQAFAGANSSSGTSSSSAGSSLGTGSTFALRAMATFSLSDLSMTGWAAGELRFELPSPPGNDLLRPPQII